VTAGVVQRVACSASSYSDAGIRTATRRHRFCQNRITASVKPDNSGFLGKADAGVACSEIGGKCLKINHLASIRVAAMFLPHRIRVEESNSARLVK
jgi:hypothetical protein